jgi:hypothetical protein
MNVFAPRPACAGRFMGMMTVSATSHVNPATPL